MKNLVHVFLMILSLQAVAQVTGVDYLVEFNNTTDLYDCKIRINSGETTEAMDRVQFDAQYVIVVPAGEALAIVDRQNPLYDNINYDGTIPNDWTVSYEVMSPAGQQENDFYVISPDLVTVSMYNDLFTGDEVVLFSVSVSDVCLFEVRPTDHNFDIPEVGGNSLLNEFAIGGANQIYLGNQWPLSYASQVDIQIDPVSVCPGDCVTLTPDYNCVPHDIIYTWETGEDTETIEVCPDNSQEIILFYDIPGLQSGEATTFVTVSDEGIVTSGATELCVGEIAQYLSTSGGWVSSAPLVASVDQTGLVSAMSPGIAIISNGLDTNCPSEVSVLVSELPLIELVSDDIICVGGTTQFFPSTGVTWTSINSSVATIDNQGLVTGVGAGSVKFFCTDPVTGCPSEASVPIVVHNTGEVFLNTTEICIGEVTVASSFAGLSGTWESSNDVVATINNAGIITGISAGTVNFVFTSTLTGCPTEISADLLVTNCEAQALPLFCEDALYFCDIADMEGFHGIVGEIDNTEGPSPLCPSGGAANSLGWIRFLAPSEGTYAVTIRPYNCIENGPTDLGIQLGVYTDCSFTEVVYCSPECNTNPRSFSSFDLTPGLEYFLWIDGCGDSVCEYEIQISGSFTSDCDDPCGDAVATEWDYAFAGTLNNDYDIAAYSTGSDLMSDGLDHLIFYDNGTGDIRLKLNSGQGYLDEEVVVNSNDDHDPNGQYEITLSDIDNDGRTDLILTETNLFMGDRLSVYHNLSDGIFVEVIDEMLCGMQGPEKLQVYDFDTNGIKDIFWICTDYLSGVIFIGADWTLQRKEYSQEFCYNTILGDFNDDGVTDILFNNGTLLVNDQDNFDIRELPGVSLDCNTPYLYNEETRILINPFFTHQLSGAFEETEQQLCSDHFLGEEEAYVFLSNICSTSDQQVVVPTASGISVFDFDVDCSLDYDVINVEDVQAAVDMQIDLTLNGYTDFLVIEGQEIWAWINPKSKNKILGTAYIDANGNGAYDGDEQPLRNVQVTLSPGNMTLLTGDDGTYDFLLDDGTYTLTAQTTTGMWQSGVLSLDNVSISEPCNEGYDFGFVPADAPDLSADISVMNTIARCDFETRFDITIENTTAQPFAGSLVFVFDDETSFFSSNISGYTLMGNEVTAPTGTLQPYQPEKYTITLKMPSGSSNLPLLAFSATLYDAAGVEITSYAYTDQLRCSYDPNDKRTYPDREGEDNLTLMDEDIEYTIRFQNNGNDTAFQVTIVDPIDPNIEPSSIRVVAASHDVEACIEDTDLVFTFADIMLVDSMTNYPGSQGYVTFRCQSKEGRAELTPVYNQADIIFDTNAPIITNQTLNTLVSSLCSDVTNTLEVSICEGETFSDYSESGVYTDTIQTVNGCDSILTIILDVQGITYSAQDLSICLGESLTIGGSTIAPSEDVLFVDTLYSATGCITDVRRYEIEVVDLEFSVADAYCVGSTFDVLPIGAWTVTSSDMTIIEIDAQGGGVAVAPGDVALTITDAVSGCSESIDVTVLADPMIEVLGNQVLCIGDSTLLSVDLAGFWVSQDDGIASIGDDGLVVANATGSVGIEFVEAALGCSSAVIIEVLPAEASECLVSTTDASSINLKIFPNPASGKLSISSQEAWSDLKIVNGQGQVVRSRLAYRGTITSIDVAELPAGVYMLVIDYNGELIVKRIAVLR